MASLKNNKRLVKFYSIKNRVENNMAFWIDSKCHVVPAPQCSLRPHILRKRKKGGGENAHTTNV